MGLLHLRVIEMGLFSRKQKAHPGTPSSAAGGPGVVNGGIAIGYMPGFYVDSPQYVPGENVVAPKIGRFRIPEEITSGIDESEPTAYNLHYTQRPQPDRGGALNFSYDLYGLPLNDVCGPWMVARSPTRPFGSFPTAFFQEAAVTNIGGLIPGQLQHQPLLDPNAPGSGYDFG